MDRDYNKLSINFIFVNNNFNRYNYLILRRENYLRD